MDSITVPRWEPLALSSLAILQMEKLWLRERHVVHPSTTFIKLLFCASGRRPERNRSQCLLYSFLLLLKQMITNLIT